MLVSTIDGHRFDDNGTHPLRLVVLRPIILAPCNGIFKLWEGERYGLEEYLEYVGLTELCARVVKPSLVDRRCVEWLLMARLMDVLLDMKRDVGMDRVAQERRMEGA